MSFILDALRRSEQERRHLADDSSPLLPPGNTHRRPWLTWLLSAVVAVNFIALAWLLLHQPADQAPAPVAIATTPAASKTLSLTEIAGRPAALPQPVIASAEPPPLPPQPMPEPPPEVALPWLFELSDNFRRSLPSIQIGMHVHARQPQSRFVMIDGRQYREGQELAPGLQLVEITAQGMVLNYQGQDFQMPLR